MDTTYQLKQLTASKQDVKAVNAFYKAQRYHGKARKGDQLFQACVDGELAAVLRLTVFGDDALLRNFCVHRECRGQGLGRRLLDYSRAGVRQTIYTFPFADLSDWYARCGAEIIEREALPQSLTPLYDSYTLKRPGLKCARFRSLSQP